jgi:protein-tyrosine phosphatase
LPTAEGVFRKLVADAGLSDLFKINSAGTHGYYTNEPPDRCTKAASESL